MKFEDATEFNKKLNNVLPLPTKKDIRVGGTVNIILIEGDQKKLFSVEITDIIGEKITGRRLSEDELYDFEFKNIFNIF